MRADTVHAVAEPLSRAAALAAGMSLAWWAQAIPSKPAVTWSTGSVSFAELNGRANQLARTLRRRGLDTGDAVAVMCGNHVEFAETVFAAVRSGLRLTPINRYLTSDEVAYILADCDAKALVVDSSLAAVASGALATASRCQVRLVAGTSNLANAGTIGSGPGELAGGSEDFAAACDPEDPSDVRYDRPAEGGPPFARRRRQHARCQHLRL